MKTTYDTKAKVLVTIGPASSSKPILREFFTMGVDVCRLNFSHGSHEDHRKVIQTIRELEEELDTSVAILADLQGPKIRIGKVAENRVDLVEGQELIITTQACLGTAEKLYLSYEQFPADVAQGDHVLIDDGKIRLEVLDTNRIDQVRLKVLNGGPLSSNKGVNLPQTKVSLPSLTEKDREDALFALEKGVDWLALSFVRKPEDIQELRKLVELQGKTTGIVAKLEKPEALEHIQEIIDASDAVMVARGDLGVELPFSQVPTVQKQIVQRCIESAKPVVIATQMLESMIQNFRPTRAEANDVANAVTDGADALMLSGETSIGLYPLEAIRAMHEVIQFTEKEAKSYHFKSLKKNVNRRISDELCAAAKGISNELDAAAIVCFTSSGYTAYKIASHRPQAPIYVFTQNKLLLRRLNMVWGVRAFYHDFDASTSTTQSMRKALNRLQTEHFVKTDDLVIFLASSPLQEKGKTNTIRVEKVGQ